MEENKLELIISKFEYIILSIFIYFTYFFVVPYVYTFSPEVLGQQVLPNWQIIILTLFVTILFFVNIFGYIFKSRFKFKKDTNK